MEQGHFQLVSNSKPPLTMWQLQHNCISLMAQQQHPVKESKSYVVQCTREEGKFESQVASGKEFNQSAIINALRLGLH
jgi:hypothetical protein